MHTYTYIYTHIHCSHTLTHSSCRPLLYHHRWTVCLYGNKHTHTHGKHTFVDLMHRLKTAKSRWNDPVILTLIFILRFMFSFEQFFLKKKKDGKKSMWFDHFREKALMFWWWRYRWVDNDVSYDDPKMRGTAVTFPRRCPPALREQCS